jgi:hypothetical protein
MRPRSAPEVAVPRLVAVGEADDGGLVAGFGGEHEGTAKGKAFVVGMGSYAEELEFRIGGHVRLRVTQWTGNDRDSDSASQNDGV